MSYSGRIQYREKHAIYGWVANTEDLSDPVWIEIETASGNVIGMRANQPRNELNEDGISAGFHGFDVHLHETDLEGEADVVVRIAETGQTLEQKKPGLKDRLKRAFYPPSNVQSSQSDTGAETAVFATIGQISGGHIQVWIDDAGKDVVPSVTVGDVAAVQEPDVMTHSFMNRTGKAYNFSVSGVQEGERIALWLHSGQRLELCETRQAPRTSFERSVVKQLARAATIAQEPNAVAVTCWSGGSNPIGRAKVLYDVLDGRRPVVLFAFMFTEFGADIWPPLTTSNAAIVTIPWADRYFYLRMARQMGLTFDTIWMCKPRMPTFELTAALAAPEAALVLDIDDNEDAFSSAKGARTKAFGLSSIGLAHFTMENIPARTAPSCTIQKDYSTHMVRHARRPRPIKALRPTKPLRVGFIGTVRIHKRIVEAAEAIKALNETGGGGHRFEFHVYGDIRPDSVRNALESAGAVLMDHIPLDDLSRHLETFHIVLTGFPPEKEREMPITYYQISSKIGDALSVGRPVLVPSSSSVEDLADTPGVFLFDHSTFADQLTAAAKQVGTAFRLPDEFTLRGAYEVFQAAEKEAQSALPAASALAHVPAAFTEKDARPTLLLVWKQHDTGLYGRRPDILARSYASAFPKHRVVVLEILYPDVDRKHREDHSNYSENAFLRELNTRKAQGFPQNGVEYHQLSISGSGQLHIALVEFLGAHAILPTNSIIVLFPVIRNLQKAYDLLSAYTVVADVVDNQLSWATGSRRETVMLQYFALCQLSDRIVFNSSHNMDTFHQQGLLKGIEDKSVLIPNWYQLPSDFMPKERARTGTNFNVFYTGNMNDRIDWSLLKDIATLDDRLRLHLIGEARRSFDDLAELLENCPNVTFHGVKNEHMTLKILEQADLAIMPHKADKFSNFMNPMKVHMYKALGLPTVSSDVPGIKASDLLTIAASKEAFLDEVRKHLERAPHQRSKVVQSETEQTSSYLALIEELRQAL